MDTRLYQVIKRPIITEKGLGVKETQHTVVFEVASDATKTEIKEAVQKVFKVKVDHVRTANFHGKFRRRGRAVILIHKQSGYGLTIGSSTFSVRKFERSRSASFF